MVRRRVFVMTALFATFRVVPLAAQPVVGTAGCDGLVVSDVSIDTRPPSEWPINV